MAIPYQIGPRKSKLARTNEALARLGATVHGIRGDIEEQRALKAKGQLAQLKLQMDAAEAKKKYDMDLAKEQGRDRRFWEGKAFAAEQVGKQIESREKIAEQDRLSREKIAKDKAYGGGSGSTSTFQQRLAEMQGIVEMPFNENNPLFYDLMAIAQKVRANNPSMVASDPGFAGKVASGLNIQFDELDPQLRLMVARYFAQNLEAIDPTFLHGVPKAPGMFDGLALKIGNMIPGRKDLGTTAVAETTDQGTVGDFEPAEAMTTDEILRRASEDPLSVSPAEILQTLGVYPEDEE